MAYDEYYSEGKYRCNHPESDFIDNSQGPIEMKRDNFVEYTHRNESANIRYDVWNNNETISTNNHSQNSSYSQTNNRINSYAQNSSYYANNNPYNYSSNKKKSSTSLIIIIVFVIWFLPAILSIVFSILASFLDSMY